MPKQDFLDGLSPCSPSALAPAQAQLLSHGLLRDKVQQPCPASSGCPPPCRPLLRVQPSPSAGLEIPPVSTHRHVPTCQIATRSSQFPIQCSALCLSLPG